MENKWNPGVTAVRISPFIFHGQHYMYYHLLSLSRYFTDHFLFILLGFYGQLQTFCPPHYPDSQKNIQHNVSCSMVPPFEDCLFPASVGQAGLGVFHRTFSPHSGITGKCQLGTFWIDCVQFLYLDLLQPWMCLGTAVTELTLCKEEVVFRLFWGGGHWDNRHGSLQHLACMQTVLLRVSQGHNLP